MLYPLKFAPIYCYRIWGGEKLKTVLNKKYEEDSIGESWEISDVDGFETPVLEGSLKGYTLKQLINEFKGDLVGDQVYENFGNDFPLLLKFIDAKTPLSIQVHPSNEIAKQRHNSFGKNEMWYVMEAEENSELIVGFEKNIDKKEFEERLEDNSILDVMHHEIVNKGDVFYIPTGRVHAIGAGVLLAEIQQTSNITYRIYDYDRVDETTGSKRELHNDLAIDVIDYEVHEMYKSSYDTECNVSNELVHSPYFKTNFINIVGSMDIDYSKINSFVLLMCVEGAVEMVYNNTVFNLEFGETILLPASIEGVAMKSEAGKVLEVYM